VNDADCLHALTFEADDIDRWLERLRVDGLIRRWERLRGGLTILAPAWMARMVNGQNIELVGTELAAAFCYGAETAFQAMRGQARHGQTTDTVIRWLCRLGGCGAEREPGALLCAAHWAKVDPELRAAYLAQQIALRAATVKCLRSAEGRQP